MSRPRSATLTCISFRLHFVAWICCMWWSSHIYQNARASLYVTDSTDTANAADELRPNVNACQVSTLLLCHRVHVSQDNMTKSARMTLHVTHHAVNQLHWHSVMQYRYTYTQSHYNVTQSVHCMHTAISMWCLCTTQSQDLLHSA